MLFTLHAAVAFAQTADTTGRRALEDGNRAMREHRVAAAAAAFEESYRLHPSPAVLLNLGQAYRALGRHIAAIEAFERYLASPPPGMDAARLATVRADVARLRATLVPLSLTIRPATATVSVDGRPQTPSAGVLTLDPGAHALEFTADGFRPRREELSLEPGQPRSLAIDLEISGARLELHSSAPAASFTIDGQLVPGTGVVSRDLPVGTHTIVVRAPGFRERRRTLQLSAGLQRVDVELDHQTNWLMPAAGGAAGLVVVGTIIAVVLATSGSGAYRSAWGNFNE